MKPVFPCPTVEWHNTSYGSISPQRPELSANGKTIVITGAGRGIGREIALGYASANAKQIALIGRTIETLASTKAEIEARYPHVTASIHVADVANEGGVREVSNKIGAWDILISNAGALMDDTSIEKADVDQWWRIFETNVKGSMIIAKSFLPTRNKGAAIVSLSASIVNVPASVPPAAWQSAYTASKMAQVKLFEHIAAENSDIFVVSVHPGVIQTDMLAATETMRSLSSDIIDDSKSLPNLCHHLTLGDLMKEFAVSLPAHFLVWITSPEAKFLRGRWVSANWDVDELKSKSDRIQQDANYLTANIIGWPFQAD